MPVFRDEPSVVVPSANNVIPKIQPDTFEGITIDTAYVPSSALLTWIEGSNWTVEYFSQVLDGSNEPTPLALDREPAYQQYKRIKKMHLKVTNPLSFSQDPSVLTMEVRGSGITYPFLKPNYGDMFIADIGDGRVGLFTITQATRATILKDSVYNIDYTMVGELSAEALNDLERKTILTFVYSQANMVSGCGPFVTEEKETLRSRLNTIYREMVSRYLTDFFSLEHSTLLVPDQLRKTYDHFVTKTILKVLDSRMDKRIRRIRELNITAEPIMLHNTLWDALLTRDPQALYGASQKAHLVSTRHFRGRHTLQAIGYTGIDRVVFPKDLPTDIDSQYDNEVTTRPEGNAFLEGRPRRPAPGPYIDQATRNAIWFQPTPMMEGVPPWKLPPDIHPVIVDDYYVLSEAFYTEQQDAQSKLEMLTWQALNREVINTDQLEGCLSSALEWDNLERFYYYPIAFILLKLAGV